MESEPESRSSAHPVPLGISTGWLLLDMALVTTMQAIVKAEGETYPAVQLVFLRSSDSSRWRRWCGATAGS
jgi:S-adenosylmethionine uptake transporter